MKLNKRNSPFFVPALALGVGLGVLFFGHKLTWMRQFDIGAVKSASGSDGVINEYNTKDETVHVRPLELQSEQGKKFIRIIITDDPERIFETSPPSALDYAVILESLHNRGYQHVNITTQLIWEDDPGLLAAGLDLRLTPFQSVVVPLALTRGPKEGKIPKMLERSIIPAHNIQGDQTLIPVVNRTALIPQFKGDTGGVRAGFHSIENNPPSSGKIAMLAQWKGKGIVPSHELLTVMQAYGTTPEHIEVHCGKHIMIGKNGPVIPIDSYGQATAPEPTDQDKTIRSLDAETIITQKKSTTPQPVIAMIHADGQRTSTTNALNSERLAIASAMINAYPTPRDGSTHKRLPLWAELIILIDLATIVFLLRTTDRVNQHLGFALTAALTLPLLYALMGITQHWMALSAPLATLLTGWIIRPAKRRSTASMPEYRASEPKPVIRA